MSGGRCGGWELEVQGWCRACAELGDWMGSGVGVWVGEKSPSQPKPNNLLVLFFGEFVPGPGVGVVVGECVVGSV